MDPLQQPTPPLHHRGRPPPPPQQQPPQRQRPPTQQQQYPYNPTLQDLTNRTNSTAPNGIDNMFRNASVTKVIILFTIVYFFLQQQQPSTTQPPIATMNIFRHVIFLRSHVPPTVSTTFSNSNHVTNGATVILIMNVMYQFYLYRIMERQMSSYQFVRFGLFVTVGSVVLEYLITKTTTTTNTYITPIVLLVHGPYSMMGALFWYYHTYIPRIYPRFVTILSIFHLSEKSLFYFYTIYLIMINNSSSVTTHHINNINSNFLFTYRGAINVFISMCIGTNLSMLYNYLSQHPIIVHTNQMIDDRIVQPVWQRLTGNNRPGATARRNNNQMDRRNQNRTASTFLQELRQRHTATATAATSTGTDHRNNVDTNAWRIPDDIPGGGGIMDEGMTAATTNAVPLLPLEDVDMEAVEQLCHMGFERPQVMAALRQSHNHVEHAANRLLSSATDASG